MVRRSEAVTTKLPAFNCECQAFTKLAYLNSHIYCRIYIERLDRVKNLSHVQYYISAQLGFVYL